MAGVTATARRLLLPLDGDIADGLVGRHNVIPDVGAEQAAAVGSGDEESAETARLGGAGGVELGVVGGKVLVQNGAGGFGLSIFCNKKEVSEVNIHISFTNKN